MNEKYGMEIDGNNNQVHHNQQGTNNQSQSVTVNVLTGAPQSQPFAQEPTEPTIRSITNSDVIRPSAIFCGRENEIREIRERASDKVVLLNGIGGIGKTEICRQIYWDYLEHPSDGIEYLAWITYRDDLGTSFFGQVTVIPAEGTYDEYLKKVKTYFNNLGKKLLLIVDNANTIQPDEIPKITGLTCRVILTSRSKIPGLTEKEYLIEALPPDMCRSVYQENSQDTAPESVPAIEEIIRLAVRHTQTVELLAKTQYAACLTAQELLEKLRKKGFSLADVEETVYGKHVDTVSNKRLIEHLAMIFDIAQIDDAEALRILKLFSLLATNTPVDAATLKGFMNISGLNAVNKLVERGWLNRNAQSFSIHPVIAETVQYVSQAEGCPVDYAFAKDMIQQMSEILKSSSKKRVDEQNKLLTHCAAVAHTLHETETDDFAVFHERIATILWETGNYGQALIFAQKAVEMAENCFGTEQPETAAAYNILGLVYCYMGNYDTALISLGKALDIREKVLGPDDLDTAITYNDMAVVYDYKGDYGNALKYDQKALEIREEKLGTEHPDTARSYGNIALVYLDMGNFEKALEFHNKALIIRETVLGTEHPDTATSYNNIGGVYKAMNNYTQALKFYNKALAIREAVLGTEHPDTANSYNNIGVVYKGMGNYTQALKIYDKAQAIFETVLGTEHPDTATLYNNIAYVYLEIDDYGHAQDYAHKAERILEAVFGHAHPNTKSIYEVLSVIYKKKQNLKKARDYAIKAGIFKNSCSSKQKKKPHKR